MPPINLLIKPASGSCNIRCEYCFYKDEAQNRTQASYGMMSAETLEALVEKAVNFAASGPLPPTADRPNSCVIAFQGGEPTLAGLDFYRQLIGFQEKYASPKVAISNAIQTNGWIIDREWADFFAKNHFLVGLSLDGNRDTHDAFRKNIEGKGTFSRVMEAARHLNEAGAEFNLLTVVNRQTARRIQSIYNFFKESGFYWQQYIPCLEPLGEAPGGRPFSLTPKAYGEFLKTLFDLWYQDMVKAYGGRGQGAVSIRQFDNYVGILAGIPPEQCGMSGACGYQNVVEADGSVYPCDFYVLDPYLLGNLSPGRDSFEEIYKKREEIGFLANSHSKDPECKGCRWFPLCRGGCKRHREPDLVKNYFCAGYKAFFAHSITRLEELAGMVIRSRG